MPTSDLSLVSTSLQNLLIANISRLAGPGGAAVAVTLGFPEDQAGADRTINLHLYHVAEDQFNRNLPGPGTDANNAATTPMSLSLFYLLTAHHSNAKKAETEQQIMGQALKTLHDFALIGPNTSVADVAGTVTKVLSPGLGDGSTVLQVVLRPLTPEDALAYWASEQQQAVRLSAYYEVRLVQLEAESAQSFANTVLSVGQWVGPKTDVTLSGSRSAMRFARPAAIGATLPDFIELSPARVFLDQPPIDPAAFADTHHFWLSGSGLAGGIRRRVVLRHDSWRDRGVPGGEIALTEAVQPPGPAPVWGVAFDDRRVDLRLARRIQYVNAAGATATLAILPGTYAARVEVVVGDRAMGMQSREIVRRSNEVLFQVAPRIRRVDPPVLIPGNPAAPPPGDEDRRRLTLRISPRFSLLTQDLEIALVIDGEAYRRVATFDPVPALNDGLFRVLMRSVTFQPFNPLVPGLHTLRFSVNGVDSQPFWVETGP